MDSLPKLIAGLQRWKLALLAALAGALSVLAMPPFFAWPILFITFPFMIWIMDAVCRQRDIIDPVARLRSKLMDAAIVGWAFGFGYFLVSIYWIGYAFLVDAERYAVLMPFAVAALPAGIALF